MPTIYSAYAFLFKKIKIKEGLKFSFNTANKENFLFYSHESNLDLKVKMGIIYCYTLKKASFPRGA